MLLKIYVIGIVIMLIWWGLISLLIFEESFYNKLDNETKQSLDELYEVLENFNSKNLQLIYFILSMVASILWPLVLPYMLFKRFSG